MREFENFENKVNASSLIQAAGAFLSKTYKGYESGFSLTFGQKVLITESFIPEFSLSTFFVSLGGSIGLWLGVGAVQLISSLISLIMYLKPKRYQEK